MRGGKHLLTLDPPRFEALDTLLKREEASLLESLRRTFGEQWTEEGADLVSPERLLLMIHEMPRDLERVVGTLVAQVKAYDGILREFRNRQNRGEVLGGEDRRRRDNFERALNTLWTEEMENYSLGYLARHGFLPGYALMKAGVSATSLDPPLEISRHLTMAVRELTPASRVYANRGQYKIRRFDFYRLKAGDPDFQPERLLSEMVLDGEHDRVLPGSAARTEGGEHPGEPFPSLELVDAELESLGRISDQEDYRFRVGFNQHLLRLPEHHGGHSGTVGTVPYRFLREASLRLVNLGPRRAGPAAPESGIGFPICTVCGESRSPFASAAEIENFDKYHRERCGRPILWCALHVNIRSDILELGPFEEDAGAFNALESVRIGARQVLEMGDQELEADLLKDAQGRSVGVMFDPFPGGCGFLPLVMEHWERIVQAGRKALAACDCDAACYKCLLHFRNQHHHALLDRNRALNALDECRGTFDRETAIPPNFVERPTHEDDADSPKEVLFEQILKEKGFPLPDKAQYRVDLPGGAWTVADFAFPEKRLLIYIDGLSKEYHGNPEQQAKDRRLRIKAKLEGWHVQAISAQGLSDKTILSGFLEELAILLGVGD